MVENWERLIRQVCLRLGGELGQKVLPVQRAKRGTDPKERRNRLADQLCLNGRLQAELRIDGTPGVLTVSADLRTGRLRTGIDIPAPEQGYPLSWAKRLVRRLAEAPADLLPKDSAKITGFRLSLLKGMGSGRGNAESGFIRSVDDAVDRFYTTVVVNLDNPTTRRTSSKERAAAG